jgi:O-antigen/teichoic acid export membrane protein
MSIYYSKKYLPSLRFNPKMFSRQTISKLLPFGLKLQFAKIADIITFQTDKAFVSYFTGVSSVTYYHLGSQLNWRIRDVPLLLLTSLLPATAELHTLNEKEKLNNLYLRGTKYLAVIAIPLMLFLGTTSHLIMVAWMGYGYELSAYISQILIFGYLINILVGVGVIVAAGMNKPEFQWHSAVLTSIVNIALVTFCGHFWGIIGIASAISFSLLVGPIYFIVTFHRYIKQPIKQFIKMTMAGPFKIAVCGASLLWIINTFILSTAGGRLRCGLILIIEAMIFFFIYIFLIWKSQHFDDIDKEFFMNNYLLSKLQRLFHRKQI